MVRHFIYRYIIRESCSQFDSLPLTSLRDPVSRRDSYADVFTIRESADGLGLDCAHLEEQLRLHADRPLRIGAFAAASNVTGLIADVAGVTALLHRYAALSVWDYATAAPHLAMDVNPLSLSGADIAIDALFFSPHKMMGGPGSPGVLVVKRKLMYDEFSFYLPLHLYANHAHNLTRSP